MSVSPELRTRLYGRANGRCECTMTVCRHHAPGQRCPHDLGGDWQVHHRVASRFDILNNVAAMCKTCHQNTRTHVPGKS